MNAKIDNDEVIYNDTRTSGKQLFAAIDRIANNNDIEPDTQKEMAARIISILKEYELTYRQAENILSLTQKTLGTMSQMLSL